MVKFILIKSPDEWATTKQACRDELVVYVFFSSVCIYIYIYIYVCVCVCVYIYIAHVLFFQRNGCLLSFNICRLVSHFWLSFLRWEGGKGFIQHDYFSIGHFRYIKIQLERKV